LQAQDSPPLGLLSFDVESYMEEGEVTSASTSDQQEETILADAVKDRLREMLTHLERDIHELDQNAEPIRSAFLAIKSQLSPELFTALSPAAFIEGHEFKIIEAQNRLADRAAQQSLNERKDVNKREVQDLRQIVDSLTEAPLKIDEELD